MTYNKIENLIDEVRITMAQKVVKMIDQKMTLEQIKERMEIHLSIAKTNIEKRKLNNG